ncbi:MAG: hypothetical protein CMM28_11240 [Rhodospirillaceae bacterium]|nr:hypothetical protein [Rhodospirillaceae bacterium]
MIKKTSLLIGTIFALISFPAVSAGIDKKAKTVYCKNLLGDISVQMHIANSEHKERAKLSKEMRKSVAAKDKKQFKDLEKEMRKFAMREEFTRNELKTMAVMWNAFCK